jgi:hypothetical protein
MPDWEARVCVSVPGRSILSVGHRWSLAAATRSAQSGDRMGDRHGGGRSRPDGRELLVVAQLPGGDRSQAPHVEKAHYETVTHPEYGTANGPGKKTVWYYINGATPGVPAHSGHPRRHEPAACA